MVSAAVLALGPTTLVGMIARSRTEPDISGAAGLARARNTGGYWTDSVSSFSGERTYHRQNYFGGRGDVVAILTSTGKQMEHPRGVRYSAYGVPTSGGGIPAGDTNADGGVVATPDITQIIGWTSAGYSVRGDFDLDGDVDNDDVNIVSSNFGKSVGWGNLSVGPDAPLTGFVGGFRKGYCGYEHDGTNPKIMHVRHRAYLADLGRWTRRDPLGYVDGASLYGYLGASPFDAIDIDGLRSSSPVPTSPTAPPAGGPNPATPQTPNQPIAPVKQKCVQTHEVLIGATRYPTQPAHRYELQPLPLHNDQLPPVPATEEWSTANARLYFTETSATARSYTVRVETQRWFTMVSAAGQNNFNRGLEPLSATLMGSAECSLDQTSGGTRIWITGGTTVLPETLAAVTDGAVKWDILYTQTTTPQPDARASDGSVVIRFGVRMTDTRNPTRISEAWMAPTFSVQWSCPCDKFQESPTPNQ